MIELIKYIVLGLIQGLTESIPISSSGHLMIFKSLMDVNVDYDALAILTNFGSLVAIIILFRKDIATLLTSFFKYLKTEDKQYLNNYRYCWMIGFGCIPAGLMGLVVHKLELFDKIENNIKVVGLSLIITAVLLFIVRNFKGTKEDKQLGIKEAITVGCFQILGLFPGISRSGSTIVGGMSAKLKRDTAFKYSFMLYIPLSIAAMGLEITEISIPTNLIFYYMISVIVACVSTLFVTKWFRKVVNEGKLIYFSIYCLIVGLLVILFL